MNNTQLNSFYIKNRLDFFNNMIDNSIALFIGNIKVDSHNDFFRQKSNIFYLTGISTPDIYLLISKNNGNLNEILYINVVNDNLYKWQRDLYMSYIDYYKISGIKNIKNCNLIFNDILNHLENINNLYIEDIDLFKKIFKLDFLQLNFINSLNILSNLRTFKKENEISNIIKSCNINSISFLNVLKKINSYKYEYNIQAQFIYDFINAGSKGFCYNPIIASGVNSTILHYSSNNCVIKEKDLILIDVGCEFFHYCCDVTRVVPYKKTFSSFEKKVYKCVIRCKIFLENLIPSGISIKEINKECVDFYLKEMKLLGIYDTQDINLSLNEKLKKMPHSFCHHIGLDVHDPCNNNIPLTKGNVFTLEPGIYIKNLFGIRLEDTYTIDNNGKLLNLTTNIPIYIDEIEDIVNY